jgi:hypothetical protein
MKPKQHNAVALGMGWLVSLGVVFVLGILSAFAFHLGPGAAEGGAGDLTMEQRELALVVEQYTGQPADLAAILSLGTGKGLPEQLEQSLRAIMRQSDRDERRMAATRLVRGMPSRCMMAAIKFLQEIPADPGRDQVLGCFLERWALEDGRRAIAFATTLESAAERELAIRSVLGGWSKSRPSEAWGWVIERTGNSRRGERWLEVIVTNLSGADRATALGLLERIKVADFQDRMAVAVMEKILETETPREAMRWLGEFPGGSSRPAAASLAQAWARTEPEAAADWLHDNFPAELDGLAEVLRDWTYVSAESAADWVWGSFSGLERRELLRSVAGEWIAGNGPAPLAEWLNVHGPDASLDGAIEVLALQTTAYDPATALIWAQSIIDPDTRSMLEIMIGRQWIRIAPDAAAANLPTLLESDSARAALLEPEYYSVDYEDTQLGYSGEPAYASGDAGYLDEEMAEEPAVLTEEEEALLLEQALLEAQPGQ